MEISEPRRPFSAIFLSDGFAYLLYCVLALVLLRIYRHQLNPDAISYFGVASEYLHHQFPDAINGYWSPLYCWLLVPFLAAGAPGPLAARLLAIPIGAGVIFAVNRLGHRLNLADDSRRAIRLAVVLPVAALGFFAVTPDLLATMLTLIYLLVLSAPDYLARPGRWVAVGIFGVAMYLAKAYAMWFFLGHFMLMHLIWAFDGKTARSRVAAAALCGVLVFVLVCLPWWRALDWKYGRFVLNTSGTYNHALEAPGALAFAPPELGLLPPPTAHAVSIWEDPTFLHIANWNEFASAANFKFFLLLLARNLGDFLEVMSCYSIFSLAIAVIAAIVAVRSRARASRPEFILVLAAFIYPIGYLLLLVLQRYLSAPAIVLVLLGAYLIDRASQAYALPRSHRTIAIWTLCLSLVPNPIWNIIRYSGHEGRRLKTVGTYISHFVPARANVASDSDWFTAMYASYFAHLRYYGVPRPGETAGDFDRDLSGQQVRYLLVWDESAWPFLKNDHRLSPAGQLPAIYEVQP